MLRKASTLIGASIAAQGRRDRQRDRSLVRRRELVGSLDGRRSRHLAFRPKRPAAVVAPETGPAGGSGHSRRSHARAGEIEPRCRHGPAGVATNGSVHLRSLWIGPVLAGRLPSVGAPMARLSRVSPPAGASVAPPPLARRHLRPPGQPSGDPHLRSANEVTGHSVQGSDGEIGHVEDFLVDAEGWAVRYIIVDPKNWWPGKHVLIAPSWVEGIRLGWSYCAHEP